MSKPSCGSDWAGGLDRTEVVGDLVDRLVMPGDEDETGSVADLAGETTLLAGREPGDHHDAESGGRKRLDRCRRPVAAL